MNGYAGCASFAILGPQIQKVEQILLVEVDQPIYEVLAPSPGDLTQETLSFISP